MERIGKKRQGGEKRKKERGGKFDTRNDEKKERRKERKREEGIRMAESARKEGKIARKEWR